MIERRPDICELEARLKAAFYGKEAARADRLPSLVLTGRLGQVSTRLEDLLSRPSRNYDMGAGHPGKPCLMEAESAPRCGPPPPNVRLRRPPMNRPC